MVRIPTKRSKPAAKTAPVKKPVLIHKKAVKAVAQKPAPAKEAPGKVAKKTSTKPATENKIPKVAALKCRALSDDQLKVWEWVNAMLTVNPTDVHPGEENQRMEIRNVDPRSQVLFNEVTGVPCLKAYTTPQYTDKILAAMKKYIPKEMMNKKWSRRLYPA